MKTLLLGLAILLGLGGLSVQAAQIAIVQTDNANLYKGPQSDSPVIGHLKAGTHLIVSTYPVGDSYKIKTAEDEIGWMKDVDLGLNPVKSSPTPSPSPSPTPGV
jgi:uncharacterized protein YgiM (DUF1202 family)